MDTYKHATARVLGPGMHRITRCIAQGAFPEAGLAGALRGMGVTHIVNVGTRPSVLTPRGHRFKGVVDLPVEDLKKLTLEYVQSVMSTIHGILEGTRNCVYIHCVLGQNRSINVLWLYLIACGLDPEVARGVIEARAPEAAVGHRSLVDDSHPAMAAAYGRQHFLPLSRREIIEPFDEVVREAVRK